MGALQASEFASAVHDGSTSLDAALTWHLRSNHYPPIPLSMLEPCKQAIHAGNLGLWETKIELPAGVTWRGYHFATASAIIEGHHLESFLDPEEGES